MTKKREFDKVEIKEDGIYIYTVGLYSVIGHEFRILMNKFEFVDYEKVIVYLLKYVLNHNPVIINEETISFHSWLLKFKEKGEYFDLWETSYNGQEFVEGVDYAIRITYDQEDTCRKFNVIPVFPTFSQNIVISKGVYDSLDIEAVRYESPSHMTGWWLTTDLYDDNIESLMNVHFYHIAFNKPEILKFLALPFGYRFYLSDKGVDVWLDNE